MEFEIEIKSDQVTAYVHNIASELTPVTLRKLQKWALVIEAQAKRNAPTDQGLLKNQINSRVLQSAEELMGIVGDPVQYAANVEYGTGQIGKETALAQGVTAPDWYHYGSQRGHFVPFNKAPGLIDWLNKHGFDVQMTSPGRYDIMLKGTGTIISRGAKGFKVSGRAQPYLTPAFMKYADDVSRDFDKLPEEIKQEAERRS